MTEKRTLTEADKHYLTSLTNRLSLGNSIGETYGGTRDIYNILGYKKTLEFQDYLNRYDRDHIASRIIDAPAKATWKEFPRIIPLDDNGEIKKSQDKKLHKLLRRLDKRTNLRGSISRADRISGIGRYGILVVGIKDGRPLEDPVGTIRSIDEIVYFTPYAENNAKIVSVETSETSPRFGLPTVYEISSNASDETVDPSALRIPSKKVHHSRVIHIAENMLENGIYGRPRLEKVYNLFDDMAKVVGGSAEFFWRIADRGMQFDLDKDTQLTDAEEEAFEEEIINWIHGLTRFIKTKGISAKSLGSETADPRGPFNPIISLMSGAVNIPQRVLMGAESGHLASTQDRASWNETISLRQDDFAEPVVVRPLMSLLVGLKVIPNIEDYTVRWPLVQPLTRMEAGDIAQKKSLALINYARHVKEMKAAGEKPVLSIDEFKTSLIDTY